MSRWGPAYHNSYEKLTPKFRGANVRTARGVKARNRALRDLAPVLGKSFTGMKTSEQTDSPTLQEVGRHP